MADIHGSPGAEPQMPAAPNAGPAPVPYPGGDYSPQTYSVSTGGYDSMPGAEVLSGVSSAMGVQESGYAHDIAAGTVTPYYPGAISPIHVHGDNDPGGTDDVAATVAEAVANAEARAREYQSDATQQGPGVIGDLMDVPLNSLDPAVGVQGAEGAYYDPPRNY